MRAKHWMLAAAAHGHKENQQVYVTSISDSIPEVISSWSDHIATRNQLICGGVGFDANT